MRFARLLRGVAGCGLAAHSTRVAESNCDRPEGTAETRSLRDGETDQRSALRQRGMAMGSQVRVIGVDHLVLNVADVERSLSFYCDKLGLTPERLEEWRRGETRIPSVRVNPTTIIDLVAAPRAQGNVDHFCLVVEETDLEALAGSGEFDVDQGAVRRYGAQGYGTSLYVRDPDGNSVELRYYG